jgi:hypothetical protein
VVPAQVMIGLVEEGLFISLLLCPLFPTVAFGEHSSRL